MLEVKILGSGCPNCLKLEKITREVIQANNIEAYIDKVTDFNEILKYNIMATPALVINERVVCAGRIPSPKDIHKWLIKANNS